MTDSDEMFGESPAQTVARIADIEIEKMRAWRMIVAAEGAEIAALLETDADQIVKAWDNLYAPEGVGVIVPVEVASMRRAAAFLRSLAPATTNGETSHGS